MKTTSTTSAIGCSLWRSSIWVSCYSNSSLFFFCLATVANPVGRGGSTSPSAKKSESGRFLILKSINKPSNYDRWELLILSVKFVDGDGILYLR